MSTKTQISKIMLSGSLANNDSKWQLLNGNKSTVNGPITGQLHL